MASRCVGARLQCLKDPELPKYKGQDLNRGLQELIGRE